MQVRREKWSFLVWEYRRRLEEIRPPLRGFRAPILGERENRWPFLEPGEDAPPALRAAADVVGRRLAFDGLPLTLAAVIETLGAGQFLTLTPSGVELLQRTGLPVDLICFFSPPPASADNPAPLVTAIAARLERGEPKSAMEAWLRGLAFRFAPTLPGFRAATDSGEQEVSLVRLQIGTGRYYLGPGDGGTLDVARQIVELFPKADFLISIEERHLEAVLPLARSWPFSRPSQAQLLVEPLPVAQWAQDSGKEGSVESAAGRVLVTMAPRYASRGEEGSTFVPGESFLMDSLAAAGHRVVQSPLIFQGGDLLMVYDPSARQRILLISEAEVYRNTPLGLSIEQVLEAFRVELGADRCVVLPACSYHLDYEVSARSTSDGVIAFVNDPDAAARTILALGIDALRRGGVLSETGAAAAQTALRQGEAKALIGQLTTPLMQRSPSYGHFPQSLADCFSTGPVDSGVGNFQRFLLALDMLVCETARRENRLPSEGLGRAYMRAIGRAAVDREALRSELRRLGWRVILVPSLGEPGRGINYLNGIHEPRRYLMPAYGGLYTPLDEQAASVFREHLGPEVQVVPVYCSESQRRVGAVRCSAACGR